MDYLRELQRRQSALLARLLTMESSREDSDETDATSQRLAAEQPLRQGKRNGREASSMAPGKKECAAVLLEGEEAMQAAPEIGEPLRAAGKRWKKKRSARPVSLRRRKRSHRRWYFIGINRRITFGEVR